MQRFYMGIFDNMLVKYGSFLVGYGVLALPVFGPGSEEYIKKVSGDPMKITKDYVRNSSLLINLSKAIGRLVVSYKDVQSLAGYTHLVYEVKNVLDDFDANIYQRAQVKGGLKLGHGGKMNTNSENIKFEGVPIVSPTGDVLVESISFEINRGMNLFITGPNGCGKSSLFRILGELWPASGGIVNKPPKEDIFYIPQRPYLPTGKFRDQIIYPHSEEYMKNTKKVSDADLMKYLEIVKLGYLVEREGGWDKENEWDDVLAGGEKQRIAMARLFYHAPKFAIMDECTSAVQLDIEAIMYSYCKTLGITLITVSHRQTLWQYHEYNLKFDGQGGWEFNEIQKE
jgi:ATP-binding cassette subfamily D (ALD) protein 3